MKRKSLLACLLALALVLSWAPPAARAADTSGTCGDNLTWTLDEDGVLTISGTGDMTDWGRSSAPWYDSREQIKTLVIESGVTRIGEDAFSGCAGLASVSIPDSVTGIGQSAFSECAGLTAVAIPASVTDIGTGAFIACSALTEVTIPAGVTGIETAVFAGCSALAAVSIPASVDTIGPAAFMKCAALTEVTIPASVLYIGEYAFYNCAALASAAIPASVITIADYAFYECTALTEVTIPASVAGIGECAFAKCPKLEGITVSEGSHAYVSEDGVLFDAKKERLLAYPGGKTGAYDIPVGVTDIGEKAFYECSGLMAVTIPEGVTVIGGSAFSGCTGLAAATIPKSVTGIGSYAFFKCGILIDVFYGGTEEQWNQIDIGRGSDALSAAQIHYGSGGDDPAPPDTSGGCGENLTWTLENGILTISGTGAMDDWERFSSAPWHGRREEITAAVIENGVTGIGDYAFSNCSALTEVTIPVSVTGVGGYAFWSCSGLTEVTLPASVTDIRELAFAGCTALTEMTLPASVTSLGDGAFVACTGLTEVTIPASVSRIGDGVFVGCSGLRAVTIPVSVTDIGGYAFYGCTGLGAVSFPASVTNIGRGAFYGCTGLTAVTIPAGVASVGRSAFADCSKLVGITVSEGSHAYVSENGVLFDVKKETLVAYPGGKTGAYSIPAGVRGIGGDAFSGCTGLTSVDIPAGVTDIGEDAFSGCTGLTSVTIPESVKNIQSSVFHGCDSLKDVYYGGTEEQWDQISIESGNDPLTKAQIHYNSGGAGPAGAELIGVVELPAPGGGISALRMFACADSPGTYLAGVAVYELDGRMRYFEVRQVQLTGEESDTEFNLYKYPDMFGVPRKMKVTAFLLDGALAPCGATSSELMIRFG